MRDKRFPVLFVILIFSTSFNLVRCSVGQHLESIREGQKIKTNDRRSAGLVPYPRIGRNSEGTNFPRSIRALGMVHYPRTGRSDASNFGKLGRLHDILSDAGIELYGVRDIDIDSFLDPNYEEYANRAMSFKHIEKMLKDWFMPDDVHGYKDLHFAQKMDDPQSYYSILRGPRSSQRQGGYTPRLGRESENDSTNFL